VTFLNASGQGVGTYDWSILQSLVIRVNETFTADVTLVPGAVRVASTQYRVSPSWTNVRCP
jgi:hypothetical protein